MNTQDNNISIFALTDSHQEVRKLCCLFSGIIDQSSTKGRNTLICDCGDLFKGIYDKKLCIDSYLTLRKQLPEAKIVFAIGNNDFGFNQKNFAFLQETVQKFHEANINVLCSNLRDCKTDSCPEWIEPYALLEINGKKIMLTAFCINQIRLHNYGLQLIDSQKALSDLSDTIRYIKPDALIVLNHNLENSSLKLCETAEKCGIKIDLLIGGHEHSVVAPHEDLKIYYPQAFSRTMWHFDLTFSNNETALNNIEQYSCKIFSIKEVFDTPLKEYEARCGLNIPVAVSTLNLERHYEEPSSLGTFIADVMKNEAHATIGMISTGYISHALRYEKGKILTYYNIERAFSADVQLQTVALSPSELKAVLENSIRNRYTHRTNNTRFLQCSQNVAFSCYCDENKNGRIKQIYINGDALLDDEGLPLYPEHMIVCAVDPFIAAGEQDFNVLRSIGKETIMRDNKMVTIRELFIQAVKEAENKYQAGSSYPSFKLIDLEK